MTNYSVSQKPGLSSPTKEAPGSFPCYWKAGQKKKRNRIKWFLLGGKKKIENFHRKSVSSSSVWGLSLIILNYALLCSFCLAQLSEWFFDVTKTVPDKISVRLEKKRSSGLEATLSVFKIYMPCNAFVLNLKILQNFEAPLPSPSELICSLFAFWMHPGPERGAPSLNDMRSHGRPFLINCQSIQVWLIKEPIRFKQIKGHHQCQPLIRLNAEFRAYQTLMRRAPIKAWNPNPISNSGPGGGRGHRKVSYLWINIWIPFLFFSFFPWNSWTCAIMLPESSG